MARVGAAPAARILHGVVLSRRWSAFLVVVGVWTWLIWPRFGLAIWKDDRSFADGSPTAFLWVHALLIGASLVIGTTVGVLGVRAWRGTRSAEEIGAPGGPAPKD
ncbi:hypothetical protein AFR_39595 [Actinoplanes friuliensis DSM 7358]|uniref:Uncharacterized protein n=1 Tax=Actinoplanes friuliensis DSM 7358 TaxID=1246995 RepID=U5WAF5_9ACTN|nr:hypothetical protein AFR_39595 [Actinoplanes friuliensis DSM 7358]